MPVRIPLQATANQSFSVFQDDKNYQISIQSTQGVMSASISIDGTPVTSGDRFTSDAPLIPYAYLELGGGNFIFTTEGENLPAFEQFDVTQFLIYFSASEVENAR